MKSLIFFFALLLVVTLNVGYYNVAHENAPDSTKFFLKKHLTFKVKFINISTVSWGDDSLFTADDKQAVIDYCKYRLGIETQLNHPDDVRKCSEH